ncbi:hypothetical protein MMC11_004125 [Xylographa trunciseda]|nr:hypothetical protein [Xylographa trunciseda]
MEDQDIQSSPRKRLKMDTTATDPDSKPETPSKPTPADQETSASLAKPPLDPHSMQLHKEEDVGITEFIRPDLLGFTGILKKRYTDFLVNEILPSGEVVHLDDLKAPKPPGKERPVAEVKAEPLEMVDLGASGMGAASGLGEASEQRGEVGVKSEGVSEEGGNVKHEGEVVEEVPKGEVSEQEVRKQEVSKREVPEQEIPARKDVEMKDVKTEPPPSEPAGSELPLEIVKDEKKIVAPAITSLTPADEATMKTFFEHDVVQEILALFNRVLNSPHRKPKDYGTVKSAPIADRELRTKIHQELRRIFSSRLESFTDDGVLLISVAPEKTAWGARGRGGRGGSSSTGRQSNWGRQSQGTGRLGWKDLGGDYLHFTLYKENKDTMEVIAFLARQLQTKPQAFQFAGTKDRRAVTAQRVSVYRIRADRMVPAGRTLRQAKIGNYEYQPTGLELGELNGNEFVITLRDCQFPSISNDSAEDTVTAASAIVDAAAKHLSQQGYINYFGLQRFGTFSTRTDTIGKLMLQGNFEGAVSAILSFNPECLAAAQDPTLSANDTISGEDKARAWAINSFNLSGKSHNALDDLPRKFSAESNLIRHLGVKERAHDYLGALQTIPRNLRLMYVHAYQSLIWNLAASYRWKHSGPELMVGDLILIDEHKEKDKAIKTEEPEQIDADGEVIIQPSAEDSAKSADERFVRARALSSEDIASGAFSIYDIVLPTPGFDILYPDNQVMKSFYENVMASEAGGGLDPHDMRRSWKDVSLSGSYRKLLAKPSKEITFDVHAYTRDDEQFVETDLDRIYKQKDEQVDGGGRGQGHTFDKTHTNGRGARATENGKAVDQEGMKPDEPSVKTETTSEPEHMKTEEGEEVESAAEPVKLAVILKMQLGSSQYATMALRELMKLGGVRTYKPDFGGGR